MIQLRGVFYNILFELGLPMKLKIVLLAKSKNVTLIWVPGNRRMAGNEIADVQIPLPG
jgi:hypothetical protein